MKPPLHGALLLLCLAAAAPAQTTSTITGRIQDSTGGALAGVKVTARNMETGLARSVASSDDGRFVLPAMPVGAYEIRAELAGFRPVVHKGIRLTVGETAVVTFSMELGALDQEIDR